MIRFDHILQASHFIRSPFCVQQAVVRKAAVQAVIKMIEKLHNTQVLTEFLTFYHDRLTEMPLDKDTPTATEAVRALRLMSKHVVKYISDKFVAINALHFYQA